LHYDQVVKRRYHFTYDTSSVTSRSRLTTAKECADDNQADCLPPLTFSYQTGVAGVTAGTGTTPAGSSNSLVGGRFDFNGDGNPDLAVRTTVDFTTPIIGVLAGNGRHYGSVPNHRLHGQGGSMSIYTYDPEAMAVRLFAEIPGVGWIRHPLRLGPDGRLYGAGTYRAEGDFAYEFFVIQEGTAQVVRGGEHVTDLGPGYFIRLMIVSENR
jgi:hypothetical protein